MKGTISYIGDYDDDTNTYGVTVLVTGKELAKSNLGEGDSVQIMPETSELSTIHEKGDPK